MSKQAMVWDLATRLFHWALVILVGLSIGTDQFGNIELHYWSGLGILGLLIFRLLWGVIGSYYSCFLQFLCGPRSVIRYLQGQMVVTAGHNPLGGWSVLTMLLVLLVQAVTGLFMTDDVMFNAPWFYVLEEEMAAWFAEIHRLNSYVIYTFIGLHVLAISYYEAVKHRRLITAMIRGYSDDNQAETKASPVKSFWFAAVVFLLSVCVVAMIVWLAPDPPTAIF